MQNSLVNILTEARDSLTPETWRKGQYFKLENNTICMCAHGAIQRIVNPKVKPYLEKLNIIKAMVASGAAGAAAAARASAAAKIIRNNPHKSLLKIWKERTDWVKEDYGYGITDAHYLLGIVGLTMGFNDDPHTTLEVVKEKFNQAIELAMLIEVGNE